MNVIVDYGMGNSGSILNMIRKVGGQAVIASDIDSILSASSIVLPGVGNFDNGMEKLRSSGIASHLETRVLKDKVPFLGICLGMHLLFNQSQEGSSKGLGWIPGEVVRFDFSSVSNSNALKVPHMGWNELNVLDDSSLFKGLDKNSRFYFVHSYHAVCENKQNSIGTCDYGYQFDAAVQQDNIMGVQFHPEKSHRFGMAIFRNFLGLV